MMKTDYENTEAKCLENMESFYGLGNLDPDFADTFRKIIEEKVYHELNALHTAGAIGPLLKMASGVQALRMDGYMPPPLGLCASSTVAYLLEITDVDPMRYDLVFTQFGNWANYESIISEVPHSRFSKALRKLREAAPEFSVARIPFDDKATFELISDGDVIFMPILDCPHAYNLRKLLRPANFEEHMALLALIRNPLRDAFLDDYLKGKAAPEKIEYENPDVRMALGETYGTVLYFEQAVRLIKDISGIREHESFVLARLRKRRFDRKKEKLFLENYCSSFGIDEKTAEKLWDKLTLSPSVPKRWCVEQGLLTYRMAYIRAKYGDEFF